MFINRAVQVLFTSMLFLGILCWDVFSQQSIIPQEITIVRDSFGVPHIFGKTDAAVAYGLAWAHCEDDFASIEANLAPAKGLRGSLDGKAGAKMDFFFEWLGARKIVMEKFDHDLTADYKALLQGYCDGLNAYAKTHSKEVRLKKLFPITPIDLETTYLATFAAMSGAATALDATLQQKPFRNLISYGSNGFAFNPNKTSDSTTIVVNDPHWLLDGTLTFYEANLYSDEGWTLNGAFYPGMPTPANAITPNHTWNLPYNFPDLVDVYQLQLNPKNTTQYQFEGVWLDFLKHRIRLTVKIGPIRLTVKKELLQTVHGPAIRTKQGTYAFNIAALTAIGAVQELYEMSKATNYDAFRKAVASLQMPLFNIVYGDKNNEIWYVFNGKIPQRDTSVNYLNTLPGNFQKTIWRSFFPLNELPQIHNPACGYVYNTNSSPFLCTATSENPDSNKFTKTAGFQLNPDNDRSKRFREILQQKNNTFSYQDIVEIIYDTRYPNDNVTQKSRLLMNQLDPRVLGKDNREAVRVLQQCDLNVSESNLNIAFFSLVFNRLFEIVNPDKVHFLQYGLQYTLEQLKSAVSFSNKWMLKHHQKLQVPLSAITKLVRGKEAVGMASLPLLLHPSEGLIDNKLGVIRVNRTSSLLQIATYREGKLTKIETIHPYGNSNRPGSPHYADQMKMFICHERKVTTLDKNEVMLKAKQMYSPEVERQTQR